MAHDWDQAYRAGTPPWDSGVVEPLLVDFVQRRGLAPGRALEIGCGTGTNAVWLAARGFDVVALDLSPTAIERARAQATGSPPRFLVRDILVDPLDEGDFDFVFDCGVFQVFPEAAERSAFAERVAGLLSPQGVWLSLIGAAEGPRPEVGPPRRTAREVVDAIEPHLRVQELREARFTMPPAAAWACVATRR